MPPLSCGPLASKEKPQSWLLGCPYTCPMAPVCSQSQHKGVQAILNLSTVPKTWWGIFQVLGVFLTICYIVDLVSNPSGAGQVFMLACPSQKQTQITLDIHKSLVEGEAFAEPFCHSTAASHFPAFNFLSPSVSCFFFSSSSLSFACGSRRWPSPGVCHIFLAPKQKSLASLDCVRELIQWTEGHWFPLQPFGS